MKYLLIITLLCISVCSFSQKKYSQCGYGSYTAAQNALLAAKQSVILAWDEYITMENISYIDYADDPPGVHNFCYSFQVNSRTLGPLPSPSPSKIMTKPDESAATIPRE